MTREIAYKITETEGLQSQDMIRLTEIIKKSLENFKVIKTYDRNHVFFDLLKFASSTMDMEDRLNIQYMFSQFQKALKLWRTNDLVSANETLDKVLSLGISYSDECALLVKDSLLHPLIAYKSYKEEDCGKAMYDLEQSFSCIQSLHQQGFALSAHYMLEQRINYLSASIKTEGPKQLRSLISDLLINLFQVDSFYGISPLIDACHSYDEYDQLVVYVFDKILMGSDVFRVNGDLSRHTICQSLKDLDLYFADKSVHDKKTYERYKHSMRALSCCLTVDKYNFLKLILESSDEILDQRQSSTMAYLNYHMMLSLIKENNEVVYHATLEYLEATKAYQGYNYFVKKVINDLDN